MYGSNLILTDVVGMSVVIQLNLYLLPECTSIILDYQSNAKQQFKLVLKQFENLIHPGPDGSCLVRSQGVHGVCAFMNYRKLKILHNRLDCDIARICYLYLSLRSGFYNC